MRKLAFAAALLLVMPGCTKPDPAAEKAAIEGAVRGFYTAIEKYDVAGLKTDLPGGPVLFDWSKTHIDPAVEQAMLAIADKVDLAGRRAAFLNGDVVNPSEGRAAEHPAQRGMAKKAALKKRLPCTIGCAFWWRPSSTIASGRSAV